MNIVVIQGTLSRTPEPKELESGSTLVLLDVSTPTWSGVASVPVAWFDPSSAFELEQGDEVVVLGDVRRRFFRAGGVTQSRTEVVARRVCRATNKRGVTALLRDAATELGAR